MIRLVILDIEGTIINEGQLVYKILHQTFLKYGYTYSLKHIITHSAGLEKHKAIHEIISMDSDNPPKIPIVNTIYSAYNENLLSSYQLYDLRLFADARKMMQKLKSMNVLLALNTDYTTELAEMVLGKVGIELYKDFDCLVTSSDVIYTRPTPEMIFKVCHKLAIPPEKIIKVGDTKADILEGKNAKLKYSIGITTGAHSAEELKKVNPDFILHDLSEIVELVKEVNAYA